MDTLGFLQSKSMTYDLGRKFVKNLSTGEQSCALGVDYMCGGKACRWLDKLAIAPYKTGIDSCMAKLMTKCRRLSAPEKLLSIFGSDKRARGSD